MKTKSMIVALTCVASFLSLDVLAASSQEVNGSVATSSVEQRRVSLRDSILSKISGAKIVSKNLLIQKFGAKNDGKTDCCAAFSKAIKKASAIGFALNLCSSIIAKVLLSKVSR